MFDLETCLPVMAPVKAGDAPRTYLARCAESRCVLSWADGLALLVAPNRRRFVKETSRPEILICYWTRSRMGRREAAGSGPWLLYEAGQDRGPNRKKAVLMHTRVGGMHGVGTMMQRKCEGMVVQRKAGRHAEF